MNRHRTDAVSLAFGAVFLLIAGWWVIGRTVDIGLPALGWAVAMGLIVIGVLGLLGALRGGHREQVSAPPEPPRWPDE
ncbi:MAG: hypothetical protein AUG44_00785 [Actinobacteria bacterium 13_1_20CM_3_71_11]|nr:MAG: hypothetical protein AUG44_00785 [Actinobacteria bacterium 13_1_20CM_3_71_11]